MQKPLSSLLALALAAGYVQALPQPFASTANDMAVGDFSLANETASAGLSRRDDVDTQVEVGNGRVVAQDLNARPPQHPAAFGQLFNYLDGNICTEQGCSGPEHCVTAATGGEQVCISAIGNWLRGMRGDFVNGARGIFDRSVEYTGNNAGVIETGTNLIDLTAKRGRNSGYYIRVTLRNKSTGSGGCGKTVDTIAAGGSLLPEVGAVFGLVQVFCKALSYTGRATG